jgi:hypothetical protein
MRGKTHLELSPVASLAIARDVDERYVGREREREAGNDDGQIVDECPRSFDRPL